jgi:hypothetical protein
MDIDKAVVSHKSSSLLACPDAVLHNLAKYLPLLLLFVTCQIHIVRLAGTWSCGASSPSGISAADVAMTLDAGRRILWVRLLAHHVVQQSSNTVQLSSYALRSFEQTR